MSAAYRTLRSPSGRRFPLPLIGTGIALAGLLAIGTGGGATLLVPLTAAAARALPGLALDGRTRLIGAGLLPGSLVVRRDDGVRPSFLAHGIVAIAVPLAGCTTGAAA